ncbi:hypothetical protein K440DRAFT_620512 [Wilcoxina mikolae CBS 423.85]|nr:hypothetical protein K440DRAFT_620512 [Wilcoxina mikolae CBS 423.85]
MSYPSSTCCATIPHQSPTVLTLPHAAPPTPRAIGGISLAANAMGSNPNATSQEYSLNKPSALSAQSGVWVKD